MLSSWHLTPEYINRHWTEEMLASLLMARVEKTKKQATHPSPNGVPDDGQYHPEHHADVTTLAGKMAGFGSSMFKVTKR